MSRCGGGRERGSTPPAGNSAASPRARSRHRRATKTRPGRARRRCRSSPWPPAHKCRGLARRTSSGLRWLSRSGSLTQASQSWEPDGPVFPRLLRRTGGRRRAREKSCFGLQQIRHRSPLAAMAGQDHDPSGRGGGICAFPQASPRGGNAKANRQRPYRRRSSNPSPPKSSPNTALKPLGSISGTGLARRKPTVLLSYDGSNE